MSRKKADTCNLINRSTVMRWAGAFLGYTSETPNFASRQISLARNKQF